MPDRSETRLTAFLESLGVRDLPALTSPFDPGYDPATLEGHLEQSGHLMSSLKVSMACWQIASETALERKLRAAKKASVKTCTGGGPFEVATSLGLMEEYLDLCADLGFDRIEAGQGFAAKNLTADDICRKAETRGLEVQFEVGEKHSGVFSGDDVPEMIALSRRWLDAGAKVIVVEGRESALDVGLFDKSGKLDCASADRFVEALGFGQLVFEAPNKASQFAFLNHFGPEVQLSNVRLEELLRVEIYRRGLHSDAFQQDKLRPKGPPKEPEKGTQSS